MNRSDLNTSLRKRGQGLVEYALILVLVAVVVIVIMALLGGQIEQTYCQIVEALNGDLPDIEACQAPRVTCEGIANGSTISGGLRLEAVVTDNNGVANITRVEFWIDGVGNDLFQTEFVFAYCFNGGDAHGACEPHNVPSGRLPVGQHTITAKAFDSDGYTGTCTVSFTVTN